MRILRVLSLFLFIGVGLLPSVSAQGNLPPTADAMEAALNEWRLSEGLAPFKRNPSLEALARVQVEYLLKQPNIPQNIHEGVLEEGPRTRALWEPYDWPYYGITARTSLEEITVAQKTVAQGIEWWRNSAVHNAAATNPSYREFGVAAIPYENGTVFVAVLAGRPEIFPALVHPTDGTLYLTREAYDGVQPDQLSGINEFRLLDMVEEPLTDWEEWTPVRPLDDISADEFYVESSDGETSVLTHVDRDVDIIALPVNVEDTLAGQNNANTPDTLNTVPVTVEMMTEEVFALRIESDNQIYVNDFSFIALKLDTLSPVATFTDFAGIPYAGPGACFIFATEDAPIEEPESCTGPLSLIRVPPDRIFWYDNAREVLAGFFVVDYRGNQLADCRDITQPCTFEVAAYPFVAGQGPSEPVSEHIRLVYNDNAFTLLNEGGQTLDVASLEFTDGETTFVAGEWKDETIYQLPADNCLQIAASGNRSPRKPNACEIRERWVSVLPDEQFWTSETFEVLFDSVPVATCRAADRECLFELP